jgi:DNA-binding CsgD family transcriptional regulator
MMRDGARVDGKLQERRGRTALDAIVRECARDLAPAELVTRVDERLRSAVDYEGTGWMFLDPQTMARTGGVMSHPSPQFYSQMMAYEFTQDDPLGFRTLARSPSLVPVTTLWRETGGQLDRNPRYRQFLAPLDGGDEARALFRAGGACWGGLALGRYIGRGPFSEEDTALVAEVGRHVGEALRHAMAPASPRALAASAASGGTDAHTAVIVLNSDDVVEAQTPEASRLLRQIIEAEDCGLPLPLAVYSVAHQARATAAGHEGGTRAMARVQLPSGHWLAVEAAMVQALPPTMSSTGATSSTSTASSTGAASSAELGEVPGRVAVVLQPARPAQLASLLLAAMGLTPRERQIARMLMRGDMTDKIAQDLVISGNTLRNHVKAIYAKLGVAGRAEFTALLLHDEAVDL